MTLRVEETRVDAGGLARLRRLFNEVWPKDAKYTTEYLEWQYVSNPSGTVIGLDAVADDGSLLGHYAVIPIACSFRGMVVRGALSLNTAVSERARGKGLFVKLASDTFELARQRGAEFVLGVANQNSTPGFTGKLGFSVLGRLGMKVGRGFRGGALDLGPDVFHVHWSPAARDWRLRRPGCDYFVDPRANLLLRRWNPVFDIVLSSREEFVGDGALPRRGSALLAMYVGNTAVGETGASFSVPARMRSPLVVIHKSLGPSGDTPTAFCMDAVDFDLV